MLGMGGVMAKYIPHTLLLREEMGPTSSQGSMAESTKLKNRYALPSAFLSTGTVPTGVCVH